MPLKRKENEREVVVEEIRYVVSAPHDRRNCCCQPRPPMKTKKSYLFFPSLALESEVGTQSVVRR